VVVVGGPGGLQFGRPRDPFGGAPVPLQVGLALPGAGRGIDLLAVGGSRRGGHRHGTAGAAAVGLVLTHHHGGAGGQGDAQYGADHQEPVQRPDAGDERGQPVHDSGLLHRAIGPTRRASFQRSNTPDRRPLSDFA